MPRDARPVYGWIGEWLPAPFAKRRLHTSDTVRNELFASLDLYANVRDFGDEILRKKGHTNLRASYGKLQAYLRQAKAFYESAETLHFRASPLNYYYAFMNYAKAVSLLRDPLFVDKKLRHGLMAGEAAHSLRKHRVGVQSSGVFPQFYQHITGSNLAGGGKLSICALLGYVPDVQFEYGQLKLGDLRSFPSRFAIATNKSRNEFHALIAISHYNSPSFKSVEKVLNRDFEEVTVPEGTLREVFDISAELRKAFRFFESRKIYAAPSDHIDTPSIVADTVAALKRVLSFNPQNDEFLFRLNSEFRTSRLVPMNEVLAIYCVMFHLGSLVRYRPNVLEAMLSKKDAWMIERFVKSSPLTFLKHIRNMIDDRYLVYSVR
ncbi:MAG TPA: YaaC family protein [Dongiaceae bacterium]|nr:YaaC family protein [Dongiaceae bacterium]